MFVLKLGLFKIVEGNFPPFLPPSSPAKVTSLNPVKNALNKAKR